MTVRDRASDMTIELDSVAANAPDNAEGATVRTARYAINAAHASGNITGEQHAEARDVGEESGMINAEAMNSVTEKKRRWRSILTKDVMAGIPVLVQQGLNAEAIAARLGCTAGTLKVRCSQAQISLRVPKEVKVVPLVPLEPAPTPPKPPKQERSYAFAVPTTLQLSRVAMSRLRQRAEATGMTEAELVTTLLEVIAQDDLYDAVLDTAKGAA